MTKKEYIKQYVEKETKGVVENITLTPSGRAYVKIKELEKEIVYGPYSEVMAIANEMEDE